MFGLDAFHLARIQFAFYRILPHYFPGNHYRPRASYLAVLEGLCETKNGLALAVPFLVKDFCR